MSDHTSKNSEGQTDGGGGDTSYGDFRGGGDSERERNPSGIDSSEREDDSDQDTGARIDRRESHSDRSRPNADTEFGYSEFEKDSCSIDDSYKELDIQLTESQANSMKSAAYNAAKLADSNSYKANTYVVGRALLLVVDGINTAAKLSTTVTPPIKAVFTLISILLDPVKRSLEQNIELFEKKAKEYDRYADILNEYVEKHQGPQSCEYPDEFESRRHGLDIM